MRRLLKLLSRMGKVDEVAHDHFFLRGTVAEMVEIIVDLAAEAPNGQFTRGAIPRSASTTAARSRSRFWNSSTATASRCGAATCAASTSIGWICFGARRIASGAHRRQYFRKRIVPGGASGLQIREGPRAGPWWVQLPLSSATFQECTMTAISFLDALERAAKQAAQAENDFRRESVAQVKVLERERAFAHRRLNFMRSVTEAVAAAESEEIAVAAATAIMRAKLGWSSDSDARTEVFLRFVPVAQQAFASLAPPADDDEALLPDAIGALTAFETWYRETHSNPFWTLFEHYMPETPVVDF